MEENGQFMDVEFTRDNGERVVGEFELVGWAWAPADEQEAMVRSARSPARTSRRTKAATRRKAGPVAQGAGRSAGSVPLKP
jgi:hypothetical protein